MADPLSVAASIIGILAAAGKVAETLAPIISTIKDTEKCATAIYAEANSTRIILAALQALLDDLSTTPFRRRELIQVDQLIATLTDGALIFSELEPRVLRLGTSAEKWTTRIQWARKKESLDSFVARLQCFKGSISLMLNILQCESDMEAARRQQELHYLTTNVSNRLLLLERSMLGVNDLGSQDQANAISLTVEESMIRQFEFAADLESSRVYRKAQSAAEDKSFRSSIALSHAWSALSDVSLSEISVISTVALPISLGDLANSHHYESKANVLAVVREEETTDWPLTTQPVPDLRADAIAKRRVNNGVFPREYKLVIVGGGGVDKSGLNIHFEIEHGDPYDIDKKPTCQIDDEIAVFDTLDTAGQEEYSAMREQYMRTGEGFLLVYSVTSRYSFEDIVTFYHQILRVKDKDYFPMTIVGNHCLRETEREVSFQEGAAFAHELGVSFVEVDTSQVHNITMPFFDIVRKIRKYEEDLIMDELVSAREAKARRELEKFKENMKSKPRSRWLRKTRNSSSLGPIMQGF